MTCMNENFTGHVLDYMWYTNFQKAKTFFFGVCKFGGGAVIAVSTMQNLPKTNCAKFRFCDVRALSLYSMFDESSDKMKLAPTRKKN